jgi:hypothetical protein
VIVHFPQVDPLGQLIWCSEFAKHFGWYILTHTADSYICFADLKCTHVYFQTADSYVHASQTGTLFPVNRFRWCVRCFVYVSSLRNISITICCLHEYLQFKMFCEFWTPNFCLYLQCNVCQVQLSLIVSEVQLHVMKVLYICLCFLNTIVYGKLCA